MVKLSTQVWHGCLAYWTHGPPQQILRPVLQNFSQTLTDHYLFQHSHQFLELERRISETSSVLTAFSPPHLQQLLALDQPETCPAFHSLSVCSAEPPCELAYSTERTSPWEGGREGGRGGREGREGGKREGGEGRREGREGREGGREEGGKG